MRVLRQAKGNPNAHDCETYGLEPGSPDWDDVGLIAECDICGRIWQVKAVLMTNFQRHAVWRRRRFLIPKLIDEEPGERQASKLRSQMERLEEIIVENNDE